MPQERRKRLVLIDGHGLAYRMFYAIQANMSTRQGEPTNATYGFTRTLLSLIGDDDPPDYLAVSFDVGEKSFRDDIYEDYKGTREKMPDELGVQIERIHQVLDAFNIPQLEVEGYEADDVLGTVAGLADELGVDTLIVTGDKDLLQLVSDHTRVQLPANRIGADPEVYDKRAIEEKYGITVEQFVDFKALIGDSSDNIPGVRGIGEKTAVKLLNEYGTLENVYEHLDEISSTRFRNALEAGKDDAFLSQELSRIVRDVPLEFDLESCVTHDFDRDTVVEIFRDLEFRSFVNQLPGGEDAPLVDGQQLPLFGSAATTSEAERAEPITETHIVRDEAALDALVETLENAEAIAFDTETTSTDQMQARLVGISLAVTPGEGYYIPVGHTRDDDDQLPMEVVLERLRPALTDPHIPKYAHNIKYDAVVMSRHGLDVHPLSVDTMIGEWLLHPELSQRKLGLKALSFFRLGVEMTEISELLGRGRNQITMDLVPVEDAAPYAAADADITLRLAEPICREIEEQDLADLLYDIEMALVPVLADMEQAGVLVDADLLKRMSDEMSEVLDARTQEIYDIVGYEFNLNSSQQLSEALFDKLRLPAQGLRKTKSGYFSTAADVLDSLRDKDTTGIIDAILEYRELEKLRSTYLDALPQMVNPGTGRVHSSFNQTGTVTGRLSSSDPNLQNIPIRTELGRRVRDAFVAAPGNVLMAADYSQVELRILAHVSQDEALMRAFHEDQDVHRTTAATVYGIPLEEVTHAQRSFAKSVNFGLLYGMSAFRLARDSNLTLPEAEGFVKTYFERFPRVKKYLDETREQAIEQGYVETLLKRRRYFPAFQSTDRSQRAMIERRAAEREAVNMPIQGTAADIIKIAMIRLHDALHERGLHGRMILQVHDELVLEVPEGEAEETAALVTEVMQNAYPMDVPLKVEAHVGRNWGELK